MSMGEVKGRNIESKVTEGRGQSLRAKKEVIGSDQWEGEKRNTLEEKTFPFLFMTRSSCVCDVGWTGPECEAELGGCVSMPCAQGATCHPQPSGYNCTCPTGYTGEVLPKLHTPWTGHLLNQRQSQL